MLRTSVIGAFGPRSMLLEGLAGRELEDRLRALGIAEIAHERDGSRDFDVVLLLAEPGRSDPGESARRALAGAGRVCGVVTGREGRVALADELHRDGAGRVQLVQPPADGERRWILFEQSLLLAWKDSDGE